MNLTFTFLKLVIFLVGILPFNNFVLSRGFYDSQKHRVTEENFKSDIEETSEGSKGQDDVMELLNMILETISKPRKLQPRLAPGEEEVPTKGDNLEAFVLTLSPEKRKALSDLLGIVLNAGTSEIGSVPRSAVIDGRRILNLPVVNKDIEVYTLPPGQRINIQELLKFLTKSDVSGPEITTVASNPARNDTEYLKKLIFGGIHGIDQPGPELEGSVDDILKQIKEKKLKFYNFA